MVNTKVKPVAYAIDVATPQAQRLEDVIQIDAAKLRSSTASSLERKTACSITTGDLLPLTLTILLLCSDPRD